MSETERTTTNAGETGRTEQERIYIVIDTDEGGQGRELFRTHGKTIHGLPVVVQERAPGDLDSFPRCEHCRAHRHDCYALVGSRYGIPVCRACHIRTSWVDTIADSRRELARIAAERAGGRL